MVVKDLKYFISLEYLSEDGLFWPFGSCDTKSNFEENMQCFIPFNISEILLILAHNSWK